jgi:hypothetical protein
MGDVPATAVDLRYILERTGDFAPIEKRAANTALYHDPALLEVADVAQELACHTMDADAKTRCLAQSLRQFRSVRQELIADHVRRLSGELLTRWPDVSQDQLVTLVAIEATHIRDLYGTLRQLFHSAIKNPRLEDYIGKKMLLYCRTWLIVRNFQAAHEEWIARGNPAIPDVPVMVFTQNTLRRLEHGDIDITEMMRSGAHGVYEQFGNELQLCGAMIQNPLWQPNANDGDRDVRRVILHELMHAAADAKKQDVFEARHEVEAKLFDLKVLSILEGVEGAVAALRREQEGAIAYVKRGSLSMAQQLGGVAAFLHTCNTKAYLSSAMWSFPESAFSLVRRELSTGRLDHGARRQLVRKYALSRLAGEMSSVLGMRIKQHGIAMHHMGATTFDNDAFRMAMRREFRDSVRKAPVFDVPKELENDTVYQKLMTTLIRRVDRMFWTYYEKPEAAAKQHCETQLNATYTDDTLAKLYMRRKIRYDGIP